jgi:putative oxidoreductase
MALTDTSVAERIAYGRPLDPSLDDTIRVVDRPGTALIARILLGAIFVLSGITKLVNYDQTLAHMTAAGIPSTEALLVIAALAEILGGISILTGFLARIGAIGLLLFLAVTTAVFHAFWRFEEPERTMQLVNFMKNLAIGGGLFLLVAYGPGRYSLDGTLRKPMQP